jgi:hypothetical protein
MNWTRVVSGGLAAGIVTWLADFVMHGILLSDTYTRYGRSARRRTRSFAASRSGSPARSSAQPRHRARAEGRRGPAPLGLAGFFASFYNRS